MPAAAGSRSPARRAGRCRTAWPGLCLAASCCLWVGHLAFAKLAAAPSLRWPVSKPRTARAASVYEQIKNPVKTFSETVADFYKEYPQPPVLPMYRTFLVDFLTQTHLAVVDSRFKYDAVFALGLWQYYSVLMASYDKLVGGSQSERIWVAFTKAVGLNPESVKADAEAVLAYARQTPPALILGHLEGTEALADGHVAAAFQGIRSHLYTISYSIGLFRIMELCGIETTKTNAEEWAKAFKINPPSKVTSDLETYRQEQNKLQMAEATIREAEIREKKKLAERLEEKTKALVAEAAQMVAAASGER